MKDSIIMQQEFTKYYSYVESGRTFLLQRHLIAK